MSYRPAYGYDSSSIHFDQHTLDTANVYIEEIHTWRKKKQHETAEAQDVNLAAERIKILRTELDSTVSRLVLFTFFTQASFLLMPFTKYWVIPFAIFIPLFLRYAGHYITVKIALSRNNNLEWPTKS